MACLDTSLLVDASGRGGARLRAFIAFVARPAFKPRFAEAGLDYRE
jgi:hypothetical protein